MTVSARKRLPNRRQHEVIQFAHDGFIYAGGIGRFDDNTIAEIFLNTDKAGSGAETAARDSAVVVSIAFQYGVPVDEIRHALSRNGDGSASGPLGALLDIVASEAA